MGHNEIWVKAAREGAALLPARRPGLLRITGRDRLEFVHNYTTNDVKGLQPGAGCTTAISNWRGTVTDFVRILCREHDLLVVGTGGRQEVVARELGRYVIGVDVAITDVSSRIASAEIGGPRALEILPAARNLPPDAHRSVQFAPRLTDLAESENVLAEPEEGPSPATGDEDDPERSVTTCVVVRTRGFCGGGVLVLAPASAESALRDRLRRLGATAIGPEAWEIVRLEEGIPEFGRDIGEDTNVWEARLDGSVSLSKGCYLGQEIVARLYNYQKVQRYLMGLHLEGADPVAAQEPVLADGIAIGHVTSASPDLEGNLRALAMIKAGPARAGTPVSVAGRSGVLEDRPFWSEAPG